MKYLFILLTFSQLSLAAQGNLRVGDTTLVTAEFTVALDVFSPTDLFGKIENFGLYVFLIDFYFFYKKEFNNIENIFFTQNLQQDIFLNQEDSFKNFEFKVRETCLFYDCYFKYVYKLKTKRFWKKINKKSKYTKMFYGNDLSYVDLTCEFKCVYLGKHKIRTVNPRARNRKQAYTESLANVYAIIKINKIVPIPHKKN